jgi:hypothetical protein
MIHGFHLALIMVITPRGTVYTRMLGLISTTTSRWDEQLLHEIFNPVDVRRILQIPLNYRGLEDFVA